MKFSPIFLTVWMCWWGRNCASMRVEVYRSACANRNDGILEGLRFRVYLNHQGPNSERVSIIPCTVKSSFKTGFQISLQRSHRLPYDKNWFSSFKWETTSFWIWTQAFLKIEKNKDDMTSTVLLFKSVWTLWFLCGQLAGGTCRIKVWLRANPAPPPPGGGGAVAGEGGGDGRGRGHSVSPRYPNAVIF